MPSGRAKGRRALIGTISTAAHLAGALKRAAGRVFLTFFLTLIIVFALCAGGHLLFSSTHTDGILTYIVSAVLAIGWAIALALLVLVGEVVRGLVRGVRDGVSDVEKQVGDAGKLVGGVVSSVEHRGDKK